MTVRAKMHSGEVAVRLAQVRSDGRVTKKEVQTLKDVAAGRAPWGPPANAEARKAQAVVARHAEAAEKLANVTVQVRPELPPGIRIALSPHVETVWNNTLEPAEISRHPRPREGYGRELIIERTSPGPLRNDNKSFRDAGRITLSLAGKEVANSWKKGEMKEQFMDRLALAVERARLGFMDGSRVYISPPR